MESVLIRTIREREQVLRKEIKDLKEKVNILNKQKEIWFNRKEELKSKQKTFLEKIKNERDESRKSRSEKTLLKNKRDKGNKKVKGIILTIKQKRVVAADLLRKAGTRKNPKKILQLIDALEERIETEGAPYEQEKKLTAKVVKLRRELKEVEEVAKIFDEVRRKEKELAESRVAADQYHHQLQKGNQKIWEYYQNIINISKEFADVKKTQEEAFAKFVETKREFVKANEALKEKLNKLHTLNQEKVKYQKERQEKKELQHKNIVKEKVRLVEEKLREKKQITTEEILAFQAEE